MSTKATVKRTYGSRVRQHLPSSPPSTLSSPPSSTSTNLKRKRPFEDSFSTNTPLKKRLTLTSKPKAIDTQKPKQKILTQLHFSLDTSILRTCPLCNLSYTKGAPDDESLHKAHCARVLKGMEWGREEEREKIKAGVVEVAAGVKLKDGRRGRVVCFKADVGGKIGSKLTTLLETINLALSSPPLSPAILHASKAYLFLIPVATISASAPSHHREKIVGCVIAQHISTAMAIALPSSSLPPTSSPSSLIPVDPSTSLFCHPTPLPTPLGIPRLFVPSAHRRQRIATHLLDAAARTFVHGCNTPLNPHKGEVAFTQPTGMGGAVMKAWGGGGVRIYDEGQ